MPVLVSVILLLALTGAATAAPLIAVAVAAAGITGVAATIVSSVIGIALSVGLSFVAKALTPKPKKSGSSTDSYTQVTVRDALAPRRIVYGRTRVAGTIVYLTTSNSNAYLHLVIALCEGPIDAIETVLFNDEALTLDGSGNITASSYAGYGRVETYLGTASQAASANLISESGGAWTAAHQLKGVAYLYCRLAWNSSIWASGVPNITAIVRGRQVYDPRTTTTAWSENAALCLRDFLLLPTTKGGVGAVSTEIDDTSLIAAANICDEAVTLATGGTEARYTAGGVIELDDNSTPQDLVQNLLTSCGGLLSYWGGKWRLTVAAWRSPTFTVTDALIRGPLKVDTRISRRDQFNAVKGTYRSPADRYVAKDYPALTSATFETEDGGTRVYKDVNFDFCSSASMAQRLAKIELYRSRRPITVKIPCTLAAYAVVVGDIISVTHARWGWSAKTFEVMGVDWAILDDNALGIDLTCRESNSAVFDWTATEQQLVSASPATSFPNWNQVDAPSIALAAGDAELFLSGDGSVISRIKVTILPGATAFADRWEIRWKLSAASTWTDPVSIGASGSNQFWITPIDDGALYDVEVRAVTVLGGRSVWSGIYGFLALGKSSPPADVGTLSISSGILKWDYTPPADFAGFRVRYQSGSYAYWSTATAAHSALLSAGRLDVGNILSGVQTFLVKAVDSSGNESVNAAQLIVDLGTPVTANIVSTTDYKALAFLGTITSGSIDGSGNLSGASVSLWWNADDRTPFYPPDQLLFWAAGNYSDVLWSFSFTPDSSFAGAAMSILSNIAGSPWSITYRVSGAQAWWGSSDASLFWSKADTDLWWTAAAATYLPWPGRLSSISLAQYDFVVSATGGPVQPSISAFSLILDVPDITETLANVPVLSAGSRLPVTKTYRAIKSVNLTIQADGGGAVTARAEDKVSTGPLVKAFDPTGTAVAATVDAIVQGY